MKPRFPAWAALILLSMSQQSSTGAQQRRFESRADVATVYVTARAADGHLATGLRADDFEVDGGGRVHPIVAFSDIAPSLNIVAMFQTGYLPGAGGQERIREVAHSLVGQLKSPDRLRLGSFGAEIAISPILTNDSTVLERVISEELWARRDQSPLWQALSLATETLVDVPQRRVIMVFANGVDNSRLGSQANTASGVAKQTASIDAIVYAIALNTRGLSRELRQMAESSGGGAFVMREHDDPSKTMAQVIDELHHQYVLGVNVQLPEDPAGVPLRVRCRRPGIVVHTRGSYLTRND